MIERFFTQSEWFGINFLETKVDLNPNEVASPDFYSHFYRLLDERYSSVSELPKDWLEGKRETAKAVSQLIQKDSKVLSYGSGLGVVEKFLIENFKFKQIFGYDFAKKSKINYSSSDFTQVILFEELENGTFDFVYLSQVLYALDKYAAIDLLRQLNNLLKSGGILILVNTSILDSENGVFKLEALRKRINSKIRRELKWSYKREIQHKTSEQGWGYNRDNEFYEFLISEAGFDTVTFFSSAKQSFAICYK